MQRVLVSALIALASFGIGACADDSAPDISETSQDAVTTNLTAYNVGQNIVVTFDGMSGAATDWIAIAHPGDPGTTYLKYKYTNGGTTGSVTFTNPGLPAGTYEARAYYNWNGTHSYTVQQTSASFTIGAATGLNTNQTTYTAGQNITVTYSGLAGTHSDWIALAHTTDPTNVYEAWAYTPGGTSGSVTFTAPKLGAGTYVARAFNDWNGTHSYTVAKTSPTFTITGGATLTPSSLTYNAGDTVTVNFANFANSGSDWISINVPGSATTTYTAFQFVTGASGSAMFTGLPSGTYEARYHTNWNGTHSYGVLAVSRQFKINAKAGVATDFASYGANEGIVLSYSSMPGNAQDYVAVSAAGSPATSTIQRFSTNGQISGTQAFAALPAGNYEARAYVNNTSTIIAVQPFTVTATTLSTDATTYTTADPVNVSFDGMPGNAQDYIAVSAVGSSVMSYVTFFYTAGATTGTHQFTGLPAGTYEIRAYYNNSHTVSARSATFTVN